MKLKIVFGIIAVLIIILIVVVLLNESSFKKGVDAEVTALFENTLSSDTAVVTEADLRHLPSPVQRYLTRSGVVGRAKVQYARLRQRGTIRLGPEDDWMPFEADQYYSVNPPGFVWNVRAKAFPLLTMVGRDRYVGGKGNMLITLLSTLTVVDASGPELNQEAFVRYLSELPWFPGAWLSDYPSWEEIDSTSARVTMRDAGESISALLSFDEQGDLASFSADRFMMEGDGFRKERWFTPMTGYNEFEGIRIPTIGEARWMLPEGEFTYARVEILSVEYNRRELY